MRQERIGYAVTGSFCTLNKSMSALEELCKHFSDVTPILSEITASTDTRFGTAEHFRNTMETLCAKPAIVSVKEAEPIGPKGLLDLLIIAPCTGNTLAKMNAGVTDSSVTMAAKAHMRNGRPVLIAVSTNDGLSTAAPNIGGLLCRKNVFFVPFGQDDPIGKPTSLVADFGKILDAADAALRGKQLQPLLA